MGLFFNSKPKTTAPTITTSILPDEAKREILSGRLPRINCDKLFLKTGEVCHYVDKCIIIKTKITKSYRRIGASFPLFKGIRISNGRVDAKEHEFYEEIRGVLYITNKRTVAQATKNGIDKAHSTLSSIEPFTNAVELQFGSVNHCLIVPDGGLVLSVYNLIRK